MDFLILINILIAAEGSYLMLIMIVFGEENHSLRNCPCLMCHRHNGFALRNLDLAFLFIIVYFLQFSVLFQDSVSA